MAIKYPYTDFHEMNLDWTLQTVKQAGEDSSAALETAEAASQKVDDFTENLDLDQEVSDKIDQMADDGSLNQVIDPVIEDAVGDWLAANISPTTPAIDATLTVTGAGADAKVTGDNFDKAVMTRGTLTSADDADAVTQSGIYYVDANDYPDNLPVQHSGRLVVFKGYVTTNWAIACQMYFADQIVYYRIANNVTAMAGAWSGITWKEIADTSAFDSSLMNRGTLTSSQDMNTLLDPGMYYVDSGGGFPANLPAADNGRILVLKTGSSSLASNAQLYFTNYKYPRVYMRVSHSNIDATAWTGVEWQELTTKDSVTGMISLEGAQVQVPLMKGTFNTSGRYTGASNRVRPNMSFHDLVNFYLPGYEIKFYYYSENYYLNLHNQGVNPSSFLYTTDWESLDTPASPKVGTWFSFMIRKADNSNFTETDIAYVRENLVVYAPKEDVIYTQMETLPYDAVNYHAKWDALLDGDIVTRTLLGKVNNDDSLPIYAYELHLQKNWINAGYSLQTYDGTNDLYTRPKILIIAGQHGNEKCTPMDALNLAKNLISGKLRTIADKFDWYFIPLLNPWGYSHIHLDSNGDIVYGNGAYASTAASTIDKNAGIRTNGEGMDINRDWSDETYTIDGVTYGFQTKELQIVQSYVQAETWFMFFDLHQNHEDRNASMNRFNAYTSFAHDSNTDASWILHNYQLVDNANRKINMDLIDYFTRTALSKQTAVNWRRTDADSASLTYYVSTNYMGGFDNGTIGNTQHKSIAGAGSFTIETSEVAYTQSMQTDIWYNPYACSVSSTVIINMIMEVAKQYELWSFMW